MATALVGFYYLRIVYVAYCKKEEKIVLQFQFGKIKSFWMELLSNIFSILRQLFLVFIMTKMKIKTDRHRPYRFAT